MSSHFGFISCPLRRYTPPASAVIHKSSERVRQAPVKNFAGADGSSFGNAAWTRREKMSAQSRKEEAWKSEA
jgi:hypothetical protein